VLGAGVDVPLGLPVLTTMMHDLAAFARGPGASIDLALRRKLPHLRFSFDKYAGDQGEAFVAQLFTDAAELAPALRSAVEKLKTDESMRSVGAVIEKLCQMAEQNSLTRNQLVELAQLAGDQGVESGDDLLIDPHKVTLTHRPGSALRNAFQTALVRGPDLTENPHTFCKRCRRRGENRRTSHGTLESSGPRHRGPQHM
jgi:hypothetical protein